MKQIINSIRHAIALIYPSKKKSSHLVPILPFQSRVCSPGNPQEMKVTEILKSLNSLKKTESKQSVAPSDDSPLSPEIQHLSNPRENFQKN